jgi:hypothetical protein
MRRFDGPVCGALRTEREARGRKDFIILADEKRVQSEEGSEITERDSGAGGGGLNCRLRAFQVNDGEGEAQQLFASPSQEPGQPQLVGGKNRSSHLSALGTGVRHASRALVIIASLLFVSITSRM